MSLQDHAALIGSTPAGPVINRVWEGRTGVVLASGPSATQAMIDRCLGYPAIAVNDQYRFAPWADALYFADRKWWAWHRERPEFKAFAGVKISILTNAMETIPGVHHLKNANHLGGQRGFSRDPGVLATGSNSAYQAAGILIHAGCRRVVLVGVDGKPAPDGRAHNFGEHPDGSAPPYQAMKEAFKIGAAAAAEMGVELVNASPGTWIDTVPLMTLDEALSDAPAPGQPPAHRSPYVIASEVLRAGDATEDQIIAAVGDAALARRAIWKGVRKGTFRWSTGTTLTHATRTDHERRQP